MTVSTRAVSSGELEVVSVFTRCWAVLTHVGGRTVGQTGHSGQVLSSSLPIPEVVRFERTGGPDRPGVDVLN